MDSRRRTFCAAIAASAAALSGCNYSTSTMSRPRQTGDETTVVTTRRELERAFDRLQPGDTIRITEAGAPYRTTDWLDVDVDGVSVIGPGVMNLIKPADGANVGGIRIGHHEHCREIDVRGVGYHGNPEGQSDGAERLHGIAVRDARHVTLERNHVRKTHPPKHGNGGSGISVAADCRNVRILNNRIHEFGDRGIQSAAELLVVYGNTITSGLDRPIACDLWPSGTENRTGQSVTIFGNLLGDTIEGSLVGVARDNPLTSNRGFVSIFGNVGFGTHKSFCHVRGPKSLENISIQNNVSVQETDELTAENTSFAGVSVDVDDGKNVSVQNNELYRYSGHGIRVESELSDLSVQNNSVLGSQLAGIRVAGCSDGLIDGNRITNAGEAGIVVKNARRIAVRGNFVRRAGTAGIAMRGSPTSSNNTVTGNYVIANSQKPGRTEPGIRIDDSGVHVSHNTMLQQRAAAIDDGSGTTHNVYENNRTDADPPWSISSPTARLQDNIPPTGVHRGLSATEESDEVLLRFDKVYARRPWLSFGRVDGGVEDVSYERNADGQFVGATITLGEVGGTVDVRVTDI